MNKGSLKFYSLIASLPYLEFGKTPALTLQEFEAKCRDASEEEMNIQDEFENPESETRGKLQIVKEWEEFDLELRRDIAENIRKGAHAGKMVPLETLKEITAAKDPLDREKRIEKIKWTFLEEREYKYNFDYNFLVIYFLKLRILERLAKFNTAKGKEKFGTLCEVNNG